MANSLQQRYIETAHQIASIIEAGDDFWRSFFAANLIPGAHLIYGGPGVGKTTLIRAVGKAMFGGDAVVINHYEGIAPEDTMFEIRPGFKEVSKGVTEYTFDPHPRPFMTSHFALMNEMNRAGENYINSFMSVLAEGELNVHGKTLHKVPGVIWIDYNPYKGAFDEAFSDRCLSGRIMEEAGIAAQFRITKNKFDNGSGPDLVKKIKTSLSIEEMQKIWAEVQKVSFPGKLVGKALLQLNMLRACIMPWGSMTTIAKETQKTHCESCQYRVSCLMKDLERPVLTRAIDSFVLMAKGLAYFDGRAEVEEERDFPIALKASTMHRIALREQVAATHQHEGIWVDKVLLPSIQNQKESFRKTKADLETLTSLIKAENEMEAVTQYANIQNGEENITSLLFIKEYAGEVIGRIRVKIENDIMETVKDTAYQMAMRVTDFSLWDALPADIPQKVNTLNMRKRVKAFAEQFDRDITLNDQQCEQFIHAIIDCGEIQKAARLTNHQDQQYTIGHGTAITFKHFNTGHNSIALNITGKDHVLIDIIKRFI